MLLNWVCWNFRMSKPSFAFKWMPSLPSLSLLAAPTSFFLPFHAVPPDNHPLHKPMRKWQRKCAIPVSFRFTLAWLSNTAPLACQSTGQEYIVALVDHCDKYFDMVKIRLQTVLQASKDAVCHMCGNCSKITITGNQCGTSTTMAERDFVSKASSQLHSVAFGIFGWHDTNLVDNVM